MKILCTGSKQTEKECQKYFGFLPVSHRIIRIGILTARFLYHFGKSGNTVCDVFRAQAQRHMSELNLCVRASGMYSAVN